MSIELPTIADLQEAYHSKMNAAKFFVDKIKEFYTPNDNIFSIPDELYYYMDGTIFELHAASQILLQIINTRSGISEKSHKVSWNPKFKDKLKKVNVNMFNWWEEFNTSPEFYNLEAMRQYISHRGGSFVLAATNADENHKIVALSLPIRFRYIKDKPVQKPSGRSIELLDELVEAGNFLNKKYSELQNI